DQGFRDGVEIGGGMGADLFELPDVVFLRGAGRHQRPGGGDAGLLYIEETGADGGASPLMQTYSVVIAIEVGDLIREVTEGVCAIDDHGDAAGVGHIADAADGEDLAGTVGDVT